MYKLFESLKIYENCFDFKNVKTFFEHKNKDYIIDLIFDAKSLYESLYILSEIELDILRNYLLKNLIMNCKQKFTSHTSVSMFFVFKKTIIVNFVSIIKNWMLLSSKINTCFY